MNNKKGGNFSLWGGDIFNGINTKIVDHKLLEQDWYSRGQGNLDRKYKVTFNFTSDGNKTIVKLTHSDIPEEEYKDFVFGWKNFYLGPIKDLLEQGYVRSN